jgi:CheY-like chemotaxis protein
MLAYLAKSDPDGGVQQAATESLKKCKSSGNAQAEFLKQGDAYAQGFDTVLAAHQYSDVVWFWTDKGLVAMPVLRQVYGDEMSKKNYARALAVDSTSLAARAGLARAYATEVSKLNALAAAGQDVESMAATRESDVLSLGLVGVDAVDAALSKAVQTGDSIAAQALIRALSNTPNAPSKGLASALMSKDGATRSEAAVVLGQQAVQARTPASPQVIAALGEAAGREVVRTVFVIEARAELRDAALAQAQALGFAAMSADKGANALALLHRSPGIDAVIVAETLPDLTTFQVIDDLRSEARFETTPIFVLAAEAEVAAAIFGEKATGVIGSGGDMAQLVEAMGAISGDRALADVLATKACGTLSSIAAAGGNISAAVPGLVSTLSNREDAVTSSALFTLGQVGDSSHVDAIAALLNDAQRSEVARSSAADALANIFSRGATASAEVTAAIEATLASDAPAGVRAATARALGALRLQPDARERILRATRPTPVSAQN